MIKKSFILFVLITTIGWSCTSKKAGEQKSNEAAKQGFFPVTQYLLGQIKELETIPITPLLTITINGKVDSFWMKKDEVRTFAKPFVTPVIDSLSLHDFFAEKSFMDQSINAVTFSYDPVKALPDSIPLRHWDVYIDPQKSTVNRIYIVKQFNLPSASQTVQLTWDAGGYCLITTITEKQDQAAIIKEEKLTWNFDE